MTDPDPVVAAMQEAQCLNGDQSEIETVPVQPAADTLREDILDPNPEAERNEPSDRETMPTLGDSPVWPDRSGPGTIIKDSPEKLPPKQIGAPPDLTVNKITWPLIGRVTDPGRYMYRFGWLVVTAADLAIWKAYPNAAFTLIKTSTPPPVEVDDELAGEEFRLGTFELRTEYNYSESEK